jgi:hypothetical protein
MRLFNYRNFIKSLLITESKLIYSDKLKQILKKVDSPISSRLLEIEGEDIPVTNNYFDIADNKNQITFTSDRKAQEILNSEESKKVTHSGRGFLTHSDSNNYLFTQLGYTPEGNQTYHPTSTEEGVIESESTSATSGNVYCKVIFPGGISVINKNNLRKVDLTKLPFKKSRQPGRVGATIQTILRQSGSEFSNVEVEQFVNKYKSEFDRFNDAFRNFELVSGNDIHHWYQSENYLYGTSKGQLSNSCMGRASKRWLEIYTQNPNVCQLLILKDDDDQDKIKGRALVWSLDTPSGTTYVDRIYTHDDSDLELYKLYIAQQGWYLKKRYTSSTSETTMIAPDGSEIKPSFLRVMVQAKDYSGYPYLDTLKYYTPSSGNLNTNDGEYTLEDTGGGYVIDECDYCGGEGFYECDSCSGRGDIRCGDCGSTGNIGCPYCDSTGNIDCGTCDGSGEDSDSNPCPDCDGEGSHECTECDGRSYRDCPDCDGNGRVECGDCGGRGQQDCEQCS